MYICGEECMGQFLYIHSTCYPLHHLDTVQAQGLLEAVSSNYHLTDAVAILMPQLASTQECTAFIGNFQHLRSCISVWLGLELEKLGLVQVFAFLCYRFVWVRVKG